MTSRPFAGRGNEIPIRGARNLARALYGSDDSTAVNRVYHQALSLPIFRTVPKGPLLAYPSQLQAHYENLAAEAAERAAARAKGAAPIFDPPAPTAKTRKPKRRAANRRRTREREPAT